MTRKYMSIARMLIFIFPVLIIGCGDGGTGGGEEFEVDPQDQDISEEQQTRVERTEKIFYAIPSPMETVSLLKKAGAEYDKDILNDIENVDNYTSSAKMALNLGVYGSDLSYTSVFEQTQESMFYTSCAKKLSDNLNISGAFDEATMERMEDNLEDRDSLLSIISETYWIVDAYLKENDRENTSALIIVGGWVEGLYIATQVGTAGSSEELNQRIAEQKLSLDNLIGLVNIYEPDADLTKVLEDLTQSKAAYEGVSGGSGEGVVTGEENGVVVVGGDGVSNLSNEQLAVLSETVRTIRDSYIN